MDIVEQLVQYRNAASLAGSWREPVGEGYAAVPPRLLDQAINEITRLRSLAGAVSAGAGDYRGVIDAMKEFPRLAGSDYRTIANEARRDLCGNE